MPRPAHPKADSRRDSSSRMSRMTEKHERNQFSKSLSSTSAYGDLPLLHEVPAPLPPKEKYSSHPRPAISFPPPDSPEWLSSPISPLQRKTHGNPSSVLYRPPSPVSPSPTSRRSVNVGTSASAPRPPVKNSPREDTRRSGTVSPLNEYLPTPSASFNAGSAVPSTPKRRQPVNPASFYQTPPPEPVRRPATSRVSGSAVSPSIPRQTPSYSPPSEPVKRSSRKSAAASSVAPGSVPVLAEWSAERPGLKHEIPSDWKLKTHQECSRTWMQRMEANVKYKGGIIADDMGFGKTIPMVVRVLDDMALNGRVGPTLIVCPTGLLTHWQLEIEKVDPNKTASRVYKCHGSNRNKNVSFLQAQDIVITTYGIVSSDFSPMGRPQGLLAVEWRRVILDESHLIHSTGIKRAMACRALKSQCRWCMTGTPIQNKVADLYSLFDFLRITHLAPALVFPRGKREITMSSSQIAELHACHFTAFLEQTMLRRTKKDKYNWVGTLKPPLRHKVECEFSEREQRFYGVVATGGNFMVCGEYVPASKNALARYTRMRQACLHPQLVYQNVTSEQTEHFDEEETKIDLGDPTQSELDEMVDETSDTPPAVEQLDVSRVGVSTKMGKLLMILGEVKQRSGLEKTVVISQFTSYLDILASFLHKHGYKTVRYDGRMSIKERDLALQAINSDEAKITVMLVSLKAGLNLAACNNVIIMDPWFNPAVEEQAVNRVHRIGQDKTVHIYKVIIPGTIEDKILEMQRKKQEIADRVLSASEVLAQKLLSELWGQPILSY
ncbi:hypothetical protein BDZ89DRAFT_1077429 [Hymenopellis radicata]|nr:hypothetical protein BDZ89DRAFT_1077429 [Hymenopellis radicata]